MTVLQIVKALAGEEDINFGDSDTTFTRQTRTGGTTNIHYIDDKSIPANSLGGVIEDHLHAQNTDTGTTQSTFIVNSGGDSVTISSAGIGADRVFTFPDTESTQELIGATDLLSTSASLGASLVGVRDLAGHFTGTNVESCLAENASSVSAILLPFGYKRGLTPSFINTTNISLTRGIWHHSGTTDQMVYSAGSITYAPAGLSGTQLQYLYLDDSAIASSGSQIISGTQLTNSTTVPSFSNTKFGWYNGNDRCIGALYILGGSIQKFKVYSNDFYAYYAIGDLYSGANAPTASTTRDISAVVPSFCTRSKMSVVNATAANNFVFSPDSTWNEYNGICIPTGATTYLSIDIELDTDQSFYWKADTASATNLFILGYYMGDL